MCLSITLLSAQEEVANPMDTMGTAINKLQSDIKIDNKENFLLNQNFIKNNIDIFLQQ